jgi:hypothetical protein
MSFSEQFKDRLIYYNAILSWGSLVMVTMLGKFLRFQYPRLREKFIPACVIGGVIGCFISNSLGLVTNLPFKRHTHTHTPHSLQLLISRTTVVTSLCSCSSHCSTPGVGFKLWSLAIIMGRLLIIAVEYCVCIFVSIHANA